MPITKSAIKALRQSARRSKRNLKRSDAYKKIIKEIKKLVGSGKFDDAKKILPQLYKALDKAAKSHVIHTNKARRLKSRITKKIK